MSAISVKEGRRFLHSFFLTLLPAITSSLPSPLSSFPYLPTPSYSPLCLCHTPPHTHAQLFDSISICLSKGLGCPVGSLLLGPSAFIAKAQRVRKVLGGGMRQGGFLAAAGLYALQHNIERWAAAQVREGTCSWSCAIQVAEEGAVGAP